LLKNNRLILLLILVMICFIAAFMLWNLRGNWGYALTLRFGKLLALIMVGYCVGVSTILFQTITHNRILTPTLMGFDALYRLVHTILLFFFGSLAMSWYQGLAGFFIDAGLLVVFALALFRLLFVGLGKSLYLVLLMGVACGLFFRSMTGFMQRLIDPNDFVVLQDSFFANFNAYNATVLPIALAVVVVVSVICFFSNPIFDVLALGRESAINLGLDYQRMVMRVLVLVTILVAIATALVGPVSFFGILVSSLGYQLAKSARHGVILTTSTLIAIIFLVGGQFVLEHIFNFNTALPMIIEFSGGIIFIYLLLKGKIR